MILPVRRGPRRESVTSLFPISPENLSGCLSFSGSPSLVRHEPCRVNRRERMMLGATTVKPPEQEHPGELAQRPEFVVEAS